MRLIGVAGPGGGLRGSLQVRANEVRGWAFDPGAEAESVEVRLRVGERVIGAGRASLPRPDVSEALGVGGDHGFRLPFALGAEEVPRMVVEARAAPDRPWQPLGQPQPDGAEAGAVPELRRRPRRLAVRREARGAAAVAAAEPARRRAEPAQGAVGARSRLQRGLLLRRGAAPGRGPGGRHRCQPGVSRPRRRPLPGGGVPARLVVGAAGREVRRDPVPLGDPLRAGAGGAAAQARGPPRARRHADRRMRHRLRPRQGLAVGDPRRRQAALSDARSLRQRGLPAFRHPHGRAERGAERRSGAAAGVPLRAEGEHGADRDRTESQRQVHARPRVRSARRSQW